MAPLVGAHGLLAKLLLLHRVIQILPVLEIGCEAGRAVELSPAVDVVVPPRAAQKVEAVEGATALPCAMYPLAEQRTGIACPLLTHIRQGLVGVGWCCETYRSLLSKASFVSCGQHHGGVAHGGRPSARRLRLRAFQNRLADRRCREARSSLPSKQLVRRGQSP